MHKIVAHKLRLHNKKQTHQNIKDDAKQIVMQYFDEHCLSISSSTDLSEHYQAINEQLEENFDTAHQYYLARKGFLECIRSYNKKYDLNLDEPVLPIIAERDDLTIGYDWFVKGSQVANSIQTMLDIWSHKKKFTANDLIEGALYCSIVYGGLNDIKGLKAFYDWLLSEQSLNYIQMPYEFTNDAIAPNKFKKVAVILLAIKDANYGCQPDESALDDGLERYLNYIPDDLTLTFIYALANKTINKKNIKHFNTNIKGLSKKLKLEHKDIEKPNLSQLIKYANYQWRQTDRCNIDGALSVVMQNQVKTTALPPQKLFTYNRETIFRKHEPLIWDNLLSTDYSHSKESRAVPKDYPAFSKNLVKSLQDALKGTRAEAISTVDRLLEEFSQPNAQRLLSWASELLTDNSKRLDTVDKYVGCIGRDWLMLTMNESLEFWEDEDFESIYEQIILSKIKDGRKRSILKKDSEFVADNLDLEDDNKDADKVEDIDTLSIFDKFKDTQKFTYGRLRDFHDHQRKHFDAPYVYFPYGNNRQVVKANIVSPIVYQAMRDDIYKSNLDIQQRRLCLVVLSLAYQTGMRIRELIGIKLDDIADIYSYHENQPIALPVIWLKPNRHRRLKSSSAKRCIPIHCLLKAKELEDFVSLYHEQKRLKRRYLFSLGNGDHPLPDTFFSNLVKQLWDRSLGEHDFTFHSLRHTAISQLALVLKQSPLAQAMTDYDSQHCERIRKGVLASNEYQGAWFGLASLAGHLMCDTTFEYYIHTAHLLAGEKISQSKLELPLTIFEMVTGIDYQTVYRQDKSAYDASTKQVRLDRIRDHLIKKLSSKVDELFVNNFSSGERGVTCQPKDILKSTDMTVPKSSIYIHAKYDDVIAFLEEMQCVMPESRTSKLDEIALRHGININQAKTIYKKAESIFDDDRLLLSSPRGKSNQEILVKALDRAYQMSINEPEALRTFMEIFSNKHSLNTSFLHFGVKPNQTDMLKQFMHIGCKLINPSRWQVRASDEKAVTDLKRELSLDNRIRTGVRKNYHGFEVKVVQKKHKRSDKNLAVSGEYLASSGVLKYLGYVLMVLL
ncbi:tyrosine-type recombinase/integrase [Psychrobacter lutiphocae]|uniref:tyrosine-type recombinase/integrase n=1 Tax=Psychrobacter lutiphocae TaxID=540500 RepID=UPI00037467F0|nr:tyrosine-type recombinase/integrase [Psychrobacter lutiphocae]